MFPALYAILDPSAGGKTSLPLALELADAGVCLIQLRDKRASARELQARAMEFAEKLSPRGMRLIVNDRADIAAIAGAGGVHVGQEDLPVEEARRICGPSSWVGVSTHNLDQLREAAGTSADYIAVGPIFPTGTKENADRVVGIEFLRAARGLTRKPIVAIGGITLERAADVFRAGADSVAVIRDLALARDPAARAREFLSIAERVRMERGSRQG
ncbi:MAG: thiamine phosphate synthase [Candidatus Acidiferrales bacterium]